MKKPGTPYADDGTAPPEVSPSGRHLLAAEVRQDARHWDGAPRGSGICTRS
ncbi:hypothetical protein AB0E88_28950 [Streptomyces sp. NPDC028635]|uniref:hypothetical protein n=1 Tax=Streptomyces sp. NPDC028635 TaxID=3154800 RepID=UPI0034014D81